MRRHTLTLLATCAIALLASLAFAGYFTSDGWVLPTWGYANDTEFTWEVHYSLGEEQPVPTCYVWIWDGEELLGWYGMAFNTFDRVVFYTYKSTLPAGTDNSYKFTTVDDSTITQFGPDVY